MKIGQLAEATGVSTSRIRFYEKHGLMPQPTRQENGYRDYPDETVSRLKTIIISKSLGFSLSEIKQFLPDDPNDLIAREDVVAHLEAKLADVDRKIEELRDIREKVQGTIAYFTDPNNKAC